MAKTAPRDIARCETSRGKPAVKIYTCTGDDGTTGLFGGGRVSKDALRVRTYGTVDELNSVLGIARASGEDEALDKILDRLQNELFVVGSDLATPIRPEGDKPYVMRIPKLAISWVEASIDASEEELPELRNFILPGGSMQAAHLHHARTVCRRAERLVVELSQQETINGHALVFLNRLSDLLFVLGRLANTRAGVAEVIWSPRDNDNTSL